MLISEMNIRELDRVHSWLCCVECCGYVMLYNVVICCDMLCLCAVFAV